MIDWRREIYKQVQLVRYDNLINNNRQIANMVNEVDVLKDMFTPGNLSTPNLLTYGVVTTGMVDPSVKTDPYYGLEKFKEQGMSAFKWKTVEVLVKIMIDALNKTSDEQVSLVPEIGVGKGKLFILGHPETIEELRKLGNLQNLLLPR